MQGTQDVETGIIKTPQRRLLYAFFSRVFIQSLTLTFLAEWGDRSQLATIILAAREVSMDYHDVLLHLHVTVIVIS